MIIEGSEASFDFAETDPLTKTTYMGSFKVRCLLQPLETIKADRIYRELIGHVNPILASESAKNLAFAISQLGVRVIKAPPFFTNEKNPDLPGGHLPDEILIGILNKAIDAESEFREKRQKEFLATQKRLNKKFKEQIIKKKIDEDEEELKKQNEVDDGDKEQEIDLG